MNNQYLAKLIAGWHIENQFIDNGMGSTFVITHSYISICVYDDDTAIDIYKGECFLINTEKMLEIALGLGKLL